MKRLIVLFCLSAALTACNSGTNKEKAAVTTDFSKGQKVTHSFSDLKTKDVFEVLLTGDKPADMVLAFTITNAGGTKIYDLKIKAADLLGSTDPNVDLRTEAAQIDFIKNIAADFLDEEKFLDPAVTQDQVADDYAPDKSFYETLRKSGLNGFTYRLGKENNFYIAWSEAEKKVKVYYNCC